MFSRKKRLKLVMIVFLFATLITTGCSKDADTEVDEQVLVSIEDTSEAEPDEVAANDESNSESYDETEVLSVEGELEADVTEIPTEDGETDIPTSDTGIETLAKDETSEQYEVEAPDADEYYENNSEIVSQVYAKDSKNVQSEIEIYSEIAERGMENILFSAEYTMDGEYYDETEIFEPTVEKHPIYQAMYFADNGDIWTIMVINGMTMANPLSYNMQSGLSAQLIISESETVMSYDSTTNKFYETIPNDSEVIVKIVDRIDAETLEQLTVDMIDAL